MADFLRILLIACAAAAAPLAVALAPEPGEPVVVVAMPFGARGALAVMAEADGRLVATTGLGAVVVARSDLPDFVSRLRKAGALLVLNGRSIAGCLPS